MTSITRIDGGIKLLVSTVLFLFTSAVSAEGRQYRDLHTGAIETEEYANTMCMRYSNTGSDEEIEECLRAQYELVSGDNAQQGRSVHDSSQVKIENHAIQGHWKCSTTNPSGNVSQDVYIFNDNGSMQIESSGVTLLGNYTQNNSQIFITITRIPSLAKQGISPVTNMGIEGTINNISSNSLDITTVSVNSRSKRHSKCNS